jgi:excisionase family DNA binding protein
VLARGAAIRNPIPTVPTPDMWRPFFGDTLPALLSVPEAAELANVSERTVRDWVYRRCFDTVRIGKMVRIPTVSLLEFMSQVPATPTDAVGESIQ